MRGSIFGWGLALIALASFAAVPMVSAADKKVADDKKVTDEKKAEETKVEGDLKALQGTWTAPGGADGTGKTTYAFAGDKLTVTAPSRTYKITVVLDEKAKPEKSIDLKIDEAPDDAKGQTSKGVYKFEDGKFVFCFRPQGERPEKFEMIGFEQIVVTLTKEKK